MYKTKTWCAWIHKEMVTREILPVTTRLFLEFRSLESGLPKNKPRMWSTLWE